MSYNKLTWHDGKPAYVGVSEQVRWPLHLEGHMTDMYGFISNSISL